MKAKASKLDGYSARLQEWFLSGKTLKEAQEQLALDGCSVSLGRLSEWWQSRQASMQEEALLKQIASGAAQCREVEEQFAKAPAPEFDTLIKLHRVLILKLSTQGNADPEMLELVNRMMKPVVQFARLQQLNAQLALDRSKFEFDAATACLKVLPALKAISQDKGLSEPQKVQQIRLKLFGVLAEEKVKG